MREALRFAREHETPRFPLSEVKLRAPLPRPNTIRDFMVVEEHVSRLAVVFADTHIYRRAQDLPEFLIIEMAR